MQQYKSKAPLITAVQWFKDGDCMAVAPLSAIHDGPCTYCGLNSEFHGLVDDGFGGGIVCPSDWIIGNPDKAHWQIMSNEDFIKHYEKV